MHMTMTTEAKNTKKGEVSDEILRLSELLRQGRRKAKEIMADIITLEATLANKKEVLIAVVDEHNQRRQELLFEELKRKGLTWCSCCLKLVPEAKIEFIFTEGQGDFTMECDQYIEGFLRFAYLQRACSACCTNAFNLHGWKNDAEHGYLSKPANKTEGQAFFMASLVEKREDGFYQSPLDFGVWKKIDEEHCRLPELTDDEIDNFCNQLGLPPRLSVKDGKPIINCIKGYSIGPGIM